MAEDTTDFFNADGGNAWETKYVAEWEAIKSGQARMVRVQIKGDVYNGVAMGLDEEKSKVQVAWFDGNKWHGDTFSPYEVFPVPEELIPDDVKS